MKMGGCYTHNFKGRNTNGQVGNIIPPTHYRRGNAQYLMCVLLCALVHVRMVWGYMCVWYTYIFGRASYCIWTEGLSTNTLGNIPGAVLPKPLLVVGGIGR
eukprot:GHVO01034091.1.p1 GENE.GHVO01034091.1~~GHVO01034091.1.p1  ORF type:complete len:101 (+),score=9.10 GHVO01034091.1:133-435(+)